MTQDKSGYINDIVVEGKMMTGVLSIHPHFSRDG